MSFTTPFHHTTWDRVICTGWQHLFYVWFISSPKVVFVSPGLPITLGYILGRWRWTGLACVCTCSLHEQTSAAESEDRALVSHCHSLSVSTIPAIWVARPRPTLGQSGWDSCAGVNKDAWTLYHVLLGQCFPFCSVYLTCGWHMPTSKCLS